MAKFEECFDKAFDAERERYEKQGLGRFAVKPDTAKILTFFWNILACGDGKFDDLVHLDKSNNIISQPVKKEKEKEKEPKPEKPETPVLKTRGRKKSTEKTADPEINEGDDADNSGDQTT